MGGSQPHCHRERSALEPLLQTGLAQTVEYAQRCGADEAGSYSVESMNPLGRVAAMVDEWGRVECIDPMVIVHAPTFIPLSQRERAGVRA